MNAADAVDPVDLMDPLNSDDLPIADYDHLPGVAVADRAQRLGPVELELLVRYESGHRGRTPVIRQLTCLLRQQRAGDAEAETLPPGGYGPVSGAGG